jgi:hypothetical protein
LQQLPAIAVEETKTPLELGGSTPMVVAVPLSRGA